MPATSTPTSPGFAYPPMVRVPALHYDFLAEGAEKVRRRCESTMVFTSAPPMLCLRLTKAEHQAHCIGDPTPVFTLFGELLPAKVGDPVEAGAAVVLAQAPRGANPAVLLHAVQRRVERSLFDPQNFVRDPLDVEGDALAVHRLALDGLQHQQRQGALQVIATRSGHSGSPLDFYRRMPHSGFPVKEKAGSTLSALMRGTFA